MTANGRGRPPKPPSTKEMLKEVLPIENIFNEEEVDYYKQLVDFYLKDFEAEDLTSSDMDDIFDLAKNKVLEFRLLKESKDSPDRQLDTAAAIEKLGKKNEKLKESLSTRRKDRIDPNELRGFSIVDLVAAFNHEKKLQLKEKADKLREEERELLERRKEYHGNKYDSDVNEKQDEDD